MLLTALGEEFECISLLTIDRKTTYTRPCDSFMVDTTTGAADDDHHLEHISSSVSDLTLEEEILVAIMEEILQFFLELLQVTVGCLSP
jgi:hypothetical protein